MDCPLGCNFQQQTFHQMFAPQTKMELIPGGVSYTFIAPTTPNFEPFTYSQTVQPVSNFTIQQQIAMKQLELQQLENVLMKEKTDTTLYENKFHVNKKVSTSDIPELKKCFCTCEISTQTEKNNDNEGNRCVCNESKSSTNIKSHRKHRYHK